MSPSRPADCIAGDEALRRGAWPEARDAFIAALGVRETPEALEGLGLAAWWLDAADVVFDTRERAYRLYLERDERRPAARIAVWLAWDCWAFRGENVVANGWLQRARRLLEGEPDCSERAWLELREGSLCLLEEGDPDRAHAMAGEGMRVARAVGNNDLEMLGRAIQGLALVASGAVAEGMRGLDEVNAAVVAGELNDLVAIGLSCCYMIAACDRVRDYDRAVQWCTRLKAFCAKWGLRPLFAVCRTQYASICMWRGTWLEAEEELLSARDELAASRPAMTADAVVRLAELRRRQGRLTEATALLDQVEPHGLALLGRAELAYDRGDCRGAAEQAARYLRRVPTHNRTDRASGLELLVRADVALGDLDGARNALVELTAPLLQNGSVGDLVRKRMPEGVFEIGKETRLVQKASGLEVGEAETGVRFGRLGDRLEKPERYGLADDRGRLEQALLLEGESIDARGHDRVDAGRNLDGVDGLGETIRTRLTGEGFRLHQRAHTLLEKERVPFRPFAQQSFEPFQ